MAELRVERWPASASTTPPSRLGRERSACDSWSERERRARPAPGVRGPPGRMLACAPCPPGREADPGETTMGATVPGPDGQPRCRWCAAAPEFFAYHDGEWGFPVADDRRLFEKLSLEAFQSGLSWRTILAKRDNFRAAFHGFDFARVARFGERDVQRLLQDPGIVRHRGKIEAVVNNARRALELV